MAFGIKKLLKKISPSEEESQTEEKKSSRKAAKVSNIKLEKSGEKENQEADAQQKSIKPKSSKKEEKTMTKENDSSTKTAAQHQYVEVAADLLAKPSALCDLVEAQGGKAVLVFCNNPSDTDFVEVILKKRGISAVKLIGFVAPEKLEKTQERVRNSDLAAVVVTDVAARGLDFSLFPVIVNYSLPTDSEVYNIRAATSEPGARTIVSIVSPLDFANFHQLKVSTALEFAKREAPSKEDLAKAKLAKVRTCAQAKGSVMDPALSELAQQIATDSDANSIVAYLLQNLFDTLPQLQSQVDKLLWEKENLDHGSEEDEGQPFRSNGSRDSRGGNYDSRGGRGGRRGERGRDRGSRGFDSNRSDDRRDGGSRGRSGSRGGHNDDQGNYEGESEVRGGENFNDREDSRFEEGKERRRRDDRRAPPPQKIRDDRLYIGKGEKHGLSEEQFAALLKEHCGLERDQLKRFLLRKNYAFADLPEGVGAEVVKKLDGVESKSGPLYVAKATQVVTVIENEPPPADGAESEEGFEGEDEQPAV